MPVENVPAVAQGQVLRFRTEGIVDALAADVVLQGAKARGGRGDVVAVNIQATTQGATPLRLFLTMDMPDEGLDLSAAAAELLEWAQAVVTEATTRALVAGALTPPRADETRRS